MKPIEIMACVLAMGVVVCATGAVEIAYPKSRSTFQVVDDTGKAIAGMPMKMGFGDEEDTKGQTDANGRFVFEGKATTWELYYSAEKPGWYLTHGRYEFSPEPKDGRMLPWDPVVTTVVRRVGTPIPMYARHIQIKLPSTNQYWGFDLEVGDWVVPIGKGKHNDIQFKTERTIRGDSDYILHFEVALTNAADGLKNVTPIPGCAFGSPRNAMTSGYTNRFTKTLGCRPDSGYFNVEVKSGEYFIFRTRTALDTNRNVVTGQYGKITSGFNVGGYRADKVGIAFTYYLNPTPNDRNLEFDPKRNLFKDLKSTEEVTEP